MKPFNETLWDKWVFKASAPALPASLMLYEELQGLGFQLVLLTGRPEDQRAITENNLLFAGYSSWDRLILRCDLLVSYIVLKCSLAFFEFAHAWYV